MDLASILAISLFISLVIFLLFGFPVAATLAGLSLSFAGIGIITNTFDAIFLSALPNRIFGIMNNQTMLAVPLFVFMGVMLEKSKIAEELLESISLLFGTMRGGLAIAVCIVGALLAASTGIVGATVVTLGLLALPTLLKQGYDPAISTGTLAATGTLGQIIPPSIVLVLLGDVLASAFSQAQTQMGIFSPKTVSVGDLFLGSVIPGFMLVAFYIIYLLITAFLQPNKLPAAKFTEKLNLKKLLTSMFPPLALMVLVLGSILFGLATPTEAAAIGAVGATILAILKKRLSFKDLKDACDATTEISCMVFFILIGASLFSLVFRGFGGEELITNALQNLPGGKLGAFLIVMFAIFCLGFILDFIEIIFVIVPIIGPALLIMGFDPIWLGVMIALNLQTSFLTPPLGFSLFYLRSVTPENIPTTTMYKGIIPFILMQILMLVLVYFLPEIATYLPNQVYGG